MEPIRQLTDCEAGYVCGHDHSDPNASWRATTSDRQHQQHRTSLPSRHGGGARKRGGQAHGNAPAHCNAQACARPPRGLTKHFTHACLRNVVHAAHNLRAQLQVRELRFHQAEQQRRIDH